MTGLPLVAVLLGTDHHPFDRLLGWVDEPRCVPARWFVQHGSTRLPAHLDGAEMLGVTDLTDLLRRADAVVTHGGPGLIMEAHAAGHRPVVVPRDPAYHEHVDGHQLRFCARVRDTGLIDLAPGRDEFIAAVNRALGVRRGLVVPAQRSPAPQRLGSMIDALLLRGS
jgi:UDP-N-acetylglucosamine transferase subunit ALG13